MSRRRFDLMKPSIVVILTLALGFYGNPVAAEDLGTIFTVTTTDDSGPGSLRQAVADANALPGADTIEFAVTGTITLTTGELLVADDLTIDGPGAADLTISEGTYPPQRVLEVGAGSALDVSGVTIANGQANSFAGYDGGGILNAGTLTVTASVFSGNFAADTGGGIANTGTATVTDSTFSENSTYDKGGGVANTSGGTLTVTGTTFTANHADFDGGAIYASGATLTVVTDSTFSGNSAGQGGNSSGVGGAIWNYAGPLTVTGSTFSGNSALSTEYAWGGGGIGNYEGTLTVTNSTFSGNSAAYAGGAIQNDGYYASTLTVTNSTFSGNSALDGYGGVIKNGDWSPYPSTATFQNTIVTDSPSGGNCAGAIVDGGGNVQYPGTDCGGTIASADPLLYPAGLQDNGGPTQTIALEPGSPAIDAAVADNCPPTDQRGIIRPQGEGCDIGAFELESAPTITSFSPPAAMVGRPVTITGTYFTGAASVTFDGVAAAYTVDSDTQITATVPFGALTGPIAVTTPGGTATGPTDFKVKPQITRFSPTSGPPGTTVRIKGSAFTGATGVTFNGMVAAFSVVSYTTITAVVPAGATTGPIRVKTAGGVAKSKVNFTVT